MLTFWDQVFVISLLVTSVGAGSSGCLFSASAIRLLNAVGGSGGPAPGLGGRAQGCLTSLTAFPVRGAFFPGSLRVTLNICQILEVTYAIQRGTFCL